MASNRVGKLKHQYLPSKAAASFGLGFWCMPVDSGRHYSLLMVAISCRVILPLGRLPDWDLHARRRCRAT